MPYNAATIGQGLGQQPKHFVAQPSTAPNPTLSGITRDSGGNALGGCALNVYEGQTGTYRTSTNSDAEGKYTVGVPLLIPLQIVAYLPGSPDVGGVTVNTLSVPYGT